MNVRLLNSLFMGKVFIVHLLLGCPRMRIQCREKSMCPLQDICQNHLPPNTLQRSQDVWEGYRYQGCWGFILRTVEPEMTEESRNEELVPFWLRWRVRHLCSLCPCATLVSSPSQAIIRQTFFFFFARNSSWVFLLRRAVTVRQNPWFLPGGFSPFSGEWKRARRALRLQMPQSSCISPAGSVGGG